MTTRLVRSVLALAFALAYTGPAVGQIPPGDLGLGNKLGVQEMNNSGEAGEVTLFRRGNNATLVVLNLQGAPHRAQPVAIHRARGCDSTIQPAPVYRLNNLVNGHSATLLKVPMAKLLSGNYSVLVGSHPGNPNHYVSCGYLYT